MNKLKTLWYLYRYFGAGWLAYRLGYAVRTRTGWLERRLPAVGWEARPLAGFLSAPSLANPQAYLRFRKASAPAFFYRPTDREIFQPYFSQWDREGAPATQEADDLTQGRFLYFRHSIGQAGWPPNWHRNPFTGQSLPAEKHWSRIGDFDDGDVKVIWELNRFGFVYALLRAYWRTGDESYPARFWQLVEDWRAHNPPQHGPNWKCGQEISLRLMAWCSGLYGFLDSPATTAERVTMLAQMVAVSAHRIEANLRHALSQHNNHGISEGMGLWTAGLLFPEFKGARRWQDTGRAVLERLGRALIYADGAFAQHSANYQRLALQDFLWALRLAALNLQPFSQQLMERVGRAAEFLYQVQDENSGRLPCYGHNDGSLVLPLSNCDYADFRSVIQAAIYLTCGSRRYSAGPWDEDLLWLFGPQALEAPVENIQRVDFHAPEGGFYTLRTKSSFAFIHCPVYRHRPAHADTTNVDIWWRGQNMALDAGTYSYNAPPPWDHPLRLAMFHNPVIVDEADPMAPAGRFLWLPWVKGTTRRTERTSGVNEVIWTGEHDGYTHLSEPVDVWRSVRLLAGDCWLVHDNLTSDGAHAYRLQWLLPDFPYTWDAPAGQLALDTPAGKYYVCLQVLGEAEYSLVRADPQSPRGWQSPYYSAIEPALSLACIVRAKRTTFATWFGPRPAEADRLLLR